MILMALPAVAQLEVGDDWKMSLSGNAGYDYLGNIDNGVSGHSTGFSGNADLHGSFYNPNFLNFNVQPYYGRTQSNSIFGALTNSSGVNGNVNLFNGSHFPGSVSFAKNINSSGEYGMPESTIGLAQHGDNQGLAISWSALLPNLPSLTATYAISDGSSSVFGATEKDTQKDRTLTLVSAYVIAGFRLNGEFVHHNLDANLSQLLDGLPEPVESKTSGNNYEFSAQHAFPMSGSFNFAWSRSSYDYDYQDSYITHGTGATDQLNGGLNFRPARKLSLAFNTTYTDSLLGSIPSPILNEGATIITTSLGSYHSWLSSGNAFYQLLSNLTLQGTVNHQRQEFLGKVYSSTQYGGGINYNLNRPFLGSFTFSLATFDTATQDGNQGMGFIGNVNFSRRIDGWEVNANTSYSQNVQTLILVYTTSSYGWVANARRRLGNQFNFSAGYGGTHSGLTSIAGSSSSSERVSSALSWRSYSANGFYSKADGTAAFTTTGLVNIPTGLPPSLFAPGSVMVYNSHAYGFNLGGVFMRRLTVSAGYANSRGSSVDPLVTTITTTELYNGILQYRLRKIYINGGFTHLRQLVGAAGTLPVSVTSYHIGVSRWFNFF